MLVQDLIVNSLWLMSLVTGGLDLSLTLGYSLRTHCSIVRYDCFEFLRYACSATLPSHCIHYITLGLHYIPWIVLAFYPFILSYLIKKIGSPAAPIRCHIDFLNLFKTFDLPTDPKPKAPVVTKSAEYSAERIMGEKTHSARIGGVNHS